MTASSIIVCGTLKSETFFYLLQTGRASRLGLKILYCEKYLVKYINKEIKVWRKRISFKSKFSSINTPSSPMLLLPNIYKRISSLS